MRKVKNLTFLAASISKRLPPLEGSWNGTTAGLGYWKVGLEWPYNTPPGQWTCDSTIKLEDVDDLND